MNKKVLHSMLLVIVLAAAGCGGGGGGSSDSGHRSTAPAPGDPPFTAPDGADLSAVALSATTVASLGRVEVSGLPKGLTSADLYANYYVTDGDITSGTGDDPRVLPLYTLDDTVYLLPPLLDADGATIVVVITDEASRSEAFELQLGPLPPPREGAIKEVVEAVGRLLKAATEALDKDYPGEWEHWRDVELNQMPEYLMPLMQSWHAMVDPENENSLANQDLDEETRVLLERILAAMPLADALKHETTFIESGGSLFDEAAGFMMLRTSSVNRRQAAPSAFSTMSFAPMQQTQSAPRWELEGLIDITDAPSLAERLNQYEEARKEKRDLELFDATVGTYLSTVAAVAALPLGPGGAAAVSSARIAALEAVSNLVSGLASINGVAMWFLPCCIVDLETTLDPEGGLIAEEDAHMNQVKLKSAQVRAESEGVDLTRKLIDRIVNKAASLADDSLNDAVTQLYGEQVSDHIDDYGMSFIAEQFLAQFPPGSDMVFSWGVDLMAAADVRKWLNVEIDTLGASGQPILTERNTGSDAVYEFFLNKEAFNRTDSLLRFSVNPDALKSQLPIAIHTQPIELNYIEVEFEPSVIRLEEDSTDSVPFTVTVRNSILEGNPADFIEMPLTLDPGIGEVRRIVSSSNGVSQFEYIPPDDFPDDVIVTISTRATSSTGVRDGIFGTPPERTGSMLVTMSTEPEDIEVVPNTTCVENGATAQFSALYLLGGDPVTDVSWETDAGSISSTGLFTAPASGSGEARVSAYTDDTGAGANVVYGDCTCWWSGSVTGGINQRHAWNTTSIRLDEQSRIVHIDNFGVSDHDRDVYVIGFGLDLSANPVAPGATGEYSAVIATAGLSGTPGNLSPDPTRAWSNPNGWPFGPQPGPLTVTITKHEMLSGPELGESSRLLEGTVSGTVVGQQWEVVGGEPVFDVGQLNASWSGAYWFPTPVVGGLNCSLIP